MFRTVVGMGIAGWLACAPGGVRAADAAANFPNAPIRLLVGSPPGASTDTYARILAEPLGKLLGQNVLVENRTGASGIIATNAMLNAPADGYTLQFVYTSYTLSPHLYKDVKFDPVKDVAGVSLVVTSPLALVVNSTSPFKTIDDMVKRSQTKSLNFSSAGIGSGGRLTGEMLKLETGLKGVHVPYRGAAPAATALAAADGSEVASNTPAQFDAFLLADTDKWGKLVQQIGMQKE